MGEALCVIVVEGAWKAMHLVPHELDTQAVMVPAYLAAAVAWHWDYDLENMEL